MNTCNLTTTVWQGKMILTTSEDILDQMEGEAGSAFDFVTRLMRGSPNKGLKCFCRFSFLAKTNLQLWQPW